MNTANNSNALSPAQVAKILRREPAGMFKAIKGLAEARNGHFVFRQDMPEGSVFAGLDADEHYWEIGPFRAEEGFWGISGYGRKMTYTRPDGREVTWIRRPGRRTWVEHFGPVRRPNLAEGWQQV